jgi:exodeoxyribonuclease VII large subunit
MLQYERARVASLSKSLRDPRKTLQEQAQRLDEKSVRLKMAVTYLLKSRRERFERGVVRLSALEPLAPLARGFAIVRRLPGLDIVRDAAQVEKGEALRVQLGKGEIDCRVEGKNL